MNTISDIMKLLFGTAIIAALGTSCSESGVAPMTEPSALEPSAIPIEYRTSLHTRAATPYTDASQIESFRVWSATEKGNRYISDDKIEKTEGQYVQPDGQDRYWPQSGTNLGFFAVSGLDEEESIAWSDDDESCVILKDYKMVKDREAFKEDSYPDAPMHSDDDHEFDLLIATTGSVDSPAKTAASSAVSLEFRHALSCIEFRARNVDPAIDVEITGIGLKHIQNVGDLKVQLAGLDNGKFEWILPALSVGMSAQEGETGDLPGDRRKPTFKIDFKEKVELHGMTEDKAEIKNLIDKSADVGPSKCALMMIPQPLHAFNPHKGDDAYRPHGSSLMLRANIWNVADDTGIHAPDDKLVWGEHGTNGEWMLLPCGDKWEPGKKYIYTVTFGDEGTYGGYEEDEVKDDKDRVFDPVSFKVEIEPWIAGGDIVQTIQ